MKVVPIRQPKCEFPKSFMDGTKNILKDIQDGDITDIIVVGRRKSGELVTAHSVSNFATVMGGIEIIKERVLRAWIDG